MRMSILVLGGAGYIGANAVDALIEKNYKVVVLDNLSTGFQQAVHAQARFYKGDIRDKALLQQIFREEQVEAVLHFAALSLGRESVEQPMKYFSNNVYGTQVLLEVMAEFEVRHIVFSSSATVYGNSAIGRVDELAATAPLNPYGQSKVMMETMMHWADQAGQLSFVALRYFNVAGAKKDGTLGEVRPRLIPIALRVAQGRQDKMTILGDDYHTADGTCIRDYIHVSDLVAAHLLALEYLIQGGQSEIFNLGSAQGYSNLEVIKAVRKITGAEVLVTIKPRVPGDADSLVASSQKISSILGWQAKQSNIEEIIADAWKFQQFYPEGYQY